MKHLILTNSVICVVGFLIAMFLVINPAAASDLLDEYAAYQEAAAAGDLHAALPHAQRAYELGLEQFGPDSRNTALLAFNLGYIQNETLDFEAAIESLNVSSTALLAAGEVDRELFDSLLELSRAQLGAYQAPEAKFNLQQALTVAETLFGEESEEAGQVHYYLAFVPLFFELEPAQPSFDSRGVDVDPGALYLTEHPWLPYYLRETIERRSEGINGEPLMELSPEHPEGRLHLRIAQSIFETSATSPELLAGTHLIDAAYLLDAGGGEEVDSAFRFALDELLSTPYVDEYLMRLAVTWINARHRRGWDIDETAENIDRVGRLAYLRREGGIMTLVRIPPNYPRVAASSGLESVVCMRFTVSAEGRARGVEVYQSDHARLFDRTSIEAVENFIYAPRIRNGQPVDQEGVRFCFDYHLGRG